MTYKCKITEKDITYGPWEPDELELFTIPRGLTLDGYRRVSNAYCIVARIDREDWLDVLADTMFCSRADFYCKHGGGIQDSWRDHYIRTYSKDKLTVSPDIYRKMKSYT